MNKKIIIICLVMCFAFSFQAIAASDVSATDDAVSIQSNESTLAVPNVDDQLTDDNAGTFSDLNDEISGGGTITLDKNYTYDASSDSSLSEGITISKDTTLDGQGKVVIDANSQARIFNVASGTTVTLMGITFVNGNASSGNGGSIYSMGALTVTDCNFINSTAYKDGGAVYIEGDGCSLSDSTFTGNVAGDDGGAIYWEGSNGKISNVTAYNNKGISSGTSNSKGGTICLTGDEVAINDITIKISSAVSDGGALFVTGNGINITAAYLYNCSSVDGNGGAAYIIGNNTSVSNVLIDNSSAYKGGAIYWEGNNGHADNITATGNTVSGDGASMYIAGDKCEIYNSTFIDTISYDDGGAIYWTGSNGTLYNSRFSNNRGISKDGSSSRGGAISLIGSDVTIDKCNFTDSYVIYNDGADISKIDGGALFVTGNDNIISRSMFSKTDAYTNGGAIYIIGNNTVIDDCKFDDSSAILGGIIYVSGDDTTIDNIVSTNTNAEQGGAIYIAGNNTAILNSDISDSETTKQGGAVYVEGDYFTVNGSSFTDNYAVDGGGAIYCVGHYGNVYDSNFTNNVADCLSTQSGGGAIYWSGGSSGDSIDGCIFTNNIAYITESDTGITSGGGAVFWSNGGSGGRIVNSEFYYNTVHGTKDSLGGAINWDKSSNGLIDNCVFEGNAAVSDQASSNSVWVQGGAIYWRSVNGTISNSKFINCSSDQEAGAVYWSAQPSSTQLSTQGYIINCTFEDNTAKSLSNQKSGGAILVKECRNLEIQGCNFTSNTAYNGGALAVTDNVLNVNCEGCEFTDNDATFGGAVYWLGEGNITNSLFANNSAANEAGALYIKSGSSTVSYVENSTFVNNTAVSKSGAVSSYKKHVNYVNDNFTDNHATGNSATAGAILVSATYNNIINSVFDGNSAVKQGGAISSSSGELQILDSNFTNNTINKDRGGAVYIANSNVYNILVNNSNFKSNGVTGVTSDAGLGGALFANSNNVTINCCSFEDNYVNGTNKWLQGGAIAIADNKNVVLNNSYFANNYCEHEGGAVYWASTDSIIENSVFESNTANGAGTGEGYLAGGALYIKSKTGIQVNNCTVNNNTGVNGAGIIVYNAKVEFTNVTVENNTGTNGAGVYVVSGTAGFTDCEISGNVAGQNGGGAYVNSGTVTFTNTEFINNTAVNGGGLYTIVAVKFNNATFTQNHAENGGAIYETKNIFTLSNFNAYNNTATLGGAVYANTGNKITNATMQYNKADYGSAIYVATTGNYDLVDVVLLDNQALALKFSELSQTIEGNTLTVSALFEGGDNILNAIYNAKTGYVYFTNVTYWSVNNGVGYVTNTGSSRILPTKSNPSSGDTGIYQTSREAGQNITLTLYDENNNVILNTTEVTDNAGNVTFTWTGDSPASKFIRISHFEDNYYTGLFYSTKNMTNVIIDVEDITYGSVEVVNITVIPANDTVGTVPTGNVSVYLSGIWYGNYTLDSEGRFSLDISKLPVGEYPVRVDYMGDAYFLPETNQTSFEVFPVEYEIIIEVPDYNYANKGNATVKVADYVTGIVTVTIDGKEYEIDVTDSKNVTFEFEILNSGNYTANAAFPESDTYLGSSNSTNFTVFKVNSTVAIEVNYGEVTEIVVTVGEYNCTGNVTIILDGDAVEFTLDENGQAVRYVNYLDSGNHTINATYSGDRNHYSANNTRVFNVDKFPTPIIIDASNITYGENQTITVNVPVGIDTKELNITFNGISQNYTVENGTVTIQANGLAAGEYPISVFYFGDYLYERNSTSKTFWVIKAAPEMNVDVEDIVYNETEEHIVAYINQTGNVTVKVTDENNRSWFVENPEIIIENGKVTWNISTLAGGDYIAEVTYNGNENYTSLTVNRTFTVDKAQSNLTINVTGNRVGETTVINITVSPDKATGNVTVYVDGVETVYQLNENNEILIEVNDFVYGNHSVVAMYDGDRNYSSSRNSTKFLEDYAEGLFIIKANNITVDENQTLTVVVPDDAQGIVIIDVGELRYYIDLTAGERSVEIPYDFAQGEYEVNGTWINDPKYGPLSNNTNFTVVKLNSTVNLEVADIDYGETEIINVTIDTATGNVTIKVNDTVYENVAIVNGVASLPVVDLAAGYYEVTVIYPGDNRLNGNETKGNFTVCQISAPVEISTENITYGETETVTISVNATGNVTIELNGTVIASEVPLVDGKLEYIISDLNAGNYTVKVTFNGNSNVNSSSAESNFTVKKTDCEIDVEVSDIIYGDTEHITVNVNATGNVTIKVNNQVTEVALVNGKAEVNVSGLAVGKYPVEVTYNGNGNYNSVSENVSFSVVKAATSIDLEVTPDIAVGETQVINITVNNTNASGSVIINIDGRVSTATLTNGFANFTVSSLNSGNHSITVIYEGDANLTGNWTYATFAVSKLPSQVNVTGDEIDVGETAVIEIAGPAGYNGTAVVTVNGTDYSVTLKDGVGKVNITGLANGTYVVNVTLAENDKYLGSTNDSARIHVSKVETAIDASAENITVGDSAVIKVTLPEDATGNVTVVIGNITKTVSVCGGENEIEIGGVPVGEYNVSVTYNGDDKYEPANTTAKLTVSPVVTGDLKVVDQGNGTVVVVVPDNATGNVTVKVGNNNYTAEIVNGTATFDLSNETPGEHDITAVYSGDENHTASEANGTFVRPKYATPISIEVSDSYVGDTNRIVVTVPANVTEKVTIEINGVNYTAAVNSTGQAVFEIDDLAYGNKTVTATYAGDDWHVFNATTAEFVVSRLNSTVSVNAVMSDKTAIITLSDLPSDATGYVVVEIDGVEYAVNITQTKQVEVPIKTSGTYKVSATYLGDEKYLESSNTTTFKASIDDDVTIEVQNETYNGNVTVKVNVPEDATGNVTVTLDNNTTVVVPVTGGENIITLENVTEGNHSINVTYSGDDKYSSKTVLGNVTSYPSIKADDMKRGWNSPYDYKAEFLDSEGHVLVNADVQFTVNGKTYTVKTDDKGIAYLNTSKLAVGTYDITSINTVTGEKVTRSVTIVKRLLENKDITMDFVDGTYYTVLAIGDDGNPVGEGEFVDIYVHTVHYSCKTDKNGYARLKINLNPKTYTITAEYKLTKVSNKLVVKQTLKLVKKTVTVKKGKKLVLKAKLQWSSGKAIKGKVIKFKFKGKTYKAKTNSKGIAKVTIKAKITKKLKKGKKYTYSAKYLTNNVKGKVKVK